MVLTYSLYCLLNGLFQIGINLTLIDHFYRHIYFYSRIDENRSYQTWGLSVKFIVFYFVSLLLLAAVRNQPTNQRTFMTLAAVVVLPVFSGMTGVQVARGI